jgi:hypothetical protein
MSSELLMTMIRVAMLHHFLLAANKSIWAVALRQATVEKDVEAVITIPNQC